MAEAKLSTKELTPKISDFFAQISGFITIMTPIFLILVSPYGNLQAVQHMVNEIYGIKLNESNNNDGKSPQKPSSKKKRRSSKSKALSSKTGSPTSAKETEGNLLPQKAKVKPKNRTHSPPSNQKNPPNNPNVGIVMRNIEEFLPKQDPPSAPKENTTLHFETFDQMSSSLPRGDESNLISPQKSPLEHTKTCLPEERKPEDERLNVNLEPIEAAKEEIENQSPIEDSKSEEEEEEEKVPLRTSDPLEVLWQDWLKSFLKPNPEVQVLKKAKEHLIEAFDLVTIAKKVIEIDKLKACLLTHDQRVIFENLPSSVIELNLDIGLTSSEAIKQYHWKDSFKGDEVALKKAI